jgi:hypothetical protein
MVKVVFVLLVEVSAKGAGLSIAWTPLHPVFF